MRIIRRWRRGDGPTPFVVVITSCALHKLLPTFLNGVPGPLRGGGAPDGMLGDWPTFEILSAAFFLWLLLRARLLLPSDTGLGIGISAYGLFSTGLGKFGAGLGGRRFEFLIVAGDAAYVLGLGLATVAVGGELRARRRRKK